MTLTSSVGRRAVDGSTLKLKRSGEGEKLTYIEPMITTTVSATAPNIA